MNKIEKLMAEKQKTMTSKMQEMYPKWDYNAAYLAAALYNYIKDSSKSQPKPSSLPSVLGGIIQFIGRIAFAILLAYVGEILLVPFGSLLDFFVVFPICLASLIILHTNSLNLTAGKVFCVISALLAPLSIAGIGYIHSEVLEATNGIGFMILLISGTLQGFEIYSVSNVFYVICLAMIPVSLLCSITYIRSWGYRKSLNRNNKQVIDTISFCKIAFVIVGLNNYDNRIEDYVEEDMQSFHNYWLVLSMPCKSKTTINAAVEKYNLTSIGQTVVDMLKKEIGKVTVSDNIQDIFKNKLEV